MISPGSAGTKPPVNSPLSPALNGFPEHIQHIHIMGVCGTGMGALAGMLKKSGFRITGSDQQVYPPMSDFLAREGIAVVEGYSAANLEPRPDLVVVGNVITAKNPEALGLAEKAIPYASFPQTLNHFFLNGKTSLVVTGTHGKTTTSSLLATLLHGAGCEPGFMIGGLVQAFGRNFNLGQGEYFVSEGDEYDTAFFDKGPKFLHYCPKIAIITSIEFDHADIYADLDAIKKSFARLVAIMPEDGCLVACLDDPVVREITAAAPCPVQGYGLAAGLDWSLGDLAVTPEGTFFSVYKNNALFGEFKNVMPGRHNALNALAVIAVLDLLGIDRQTVAREMAGFKGIKRRQEVRGEVDGITIIDDFAHHPTSVRETLGALKAAYVGRRLIAVFEPRTNSSRRKVFQEDYASVFDAADQVIIKEAEPLKNVQDSELFSCQRLVDDLNARNILARYFAVTDEIISYLSGNARPGDVIAVLSNGGFDNIHVRLLDTLGARA